MKTVICAVLGLCLSFGLAHADLVRLESAHSVQETMDRLEAAVAGAGATVFARIDHQAGAASVDVALPPSTVLIFGSPKIGAPIVLDGITMGLDLPLRVLAYSEGDKVWMVYHDPGDVAALHGIGPDHPVLARMRGALTKLTGASAGP